MRTRLWLGLVLAAWSAAAAAAPAALPEAPPAPPPGLTVCECVSKKFCWSVVKQAFAMIVTTKKTEVEGALPGRFFPGTQTSALRRPEKDGHFLSVACGSKKVPCPSVRDLLEKRFAESSVVQSVSREPENELFDPKTWALTAKGATALEDAKRCHPGLWSELAPTLTGGAVWD